MKFFKKLFGKDDEQEVSLDLKKELPFECIEVAGNEAIEKLFELRELPNTTPVILGKPNDIGLMVDSFQMNDMSVSQIINESSNINVLNWFSECVKEDEDFYQIPHGDWPASSEPDRTISAHLNLITGRPYKQILIGLMNAKNSWEVPAQLKFGGWNSCPPPHVHVALFKQWQKEYSAKVACITSDVIEFTVASPPTTKEQALKLAEQHFLYCPDIVHQGVETIENLASTLLNSDVWYFWWD